MFLYKLHILKGYIGRPKYFAFILFLVIFSLGACNLKSDGDDFRKEKQASIVAYQAYQIYMDQKDALILPHDKIDAVHPANKSGNRMPASETNTSLEIRGLKELKTMGQIGKDPWGNGYYYKIIPNEALNFNNRTRVLVLSMGPNQTLDTTTMETTLQSRDFQVDDYGVMLEF